MILTSQLRNDGFHEELAPGGDVSVVFLAINDFSKICAASENVDGFVLFEKLTERFGELLPPETEVFELPRTGFVFLIGDDTAEPIDDLVQRLLNGTKAPFSVCGEEIDISISVGIARSPADDDTDLRCLLDQAQFAQDTTSNQAGSTCNYYDSEEAERIWDEVTLRGDFYTALEQDQFYLEYQPIVSMDDFTLRGAEALVRWDHPKRGRIGPNVFIPLAENTGQILFLDRWVLKEAVAQAETWYREVDRDFQLSVNLSAWQFRDNFLLDKIESILSDSSFPAHCLKIEITETSMMQDVERTGEVLRNLKELGVEVALDDFGTGHASFEYLSRFPIDELKIDRTFLDFDDVYAKNQKLVDVMIETGNRIDTRILAEGVEDVQQLQYVKNRGCQAAQGYLFSEPVRPGRFHELLRDRSPLYVNGSGTANRSSQRGG